MRMLFDPHNMVLRKQETEELSLLKSWVTPPGSQIERMAEEGLQPEVLAYDPSAVSYA